MTHTPTPIVLFTDVQICTGTCDPGEYDLVTDGHRAYVTGTLGGRDALAVTREGTILTAVCGSPARGSDDACEGTIRFDLTENGGWVAATVWLLDRLALGETVEVL